MCEGRKGYKEGADRIKDKTGKGMLRRWKRKAERKRSRREMKERGRKGEAGEKRQRARS